MARKVNQIFSLILKALKSDWINCQVWHEIICLIVKRKYSMRDCLLEFFLARFQLKLNCRSI